MFKTLISPLQEWLISQGRCGGCGASLSAGNKKEVRNQVTITCHCGRIFIHDTKNNSYRRALFNEI